MPQGIHWDQRKTSHPLELELQAVLTSLIWVLGKTSRPLEEQHVLLTTEALCGPI